MPQEAGSTAGHLAAAQYAAHFTWDEMARHREPQPGLLRGLIEKALQACRVLWYWHTLPFAASRFARRHAPRSRFFVFGHIHRAGVWRMGGRVVINTGAYGFPFQPRAVVIEHGTLTVWPVITDATGTGFAFKSRPIARFPLQRAAA